MDAGYVQIPAGGPPAGGGGAASPTLRPRPPYDAASWRETLFALHGRPFLEKGTRAPLLVLWAVGAALVVLSALVGGACGARFFVFLSCSRFGF